MLCVGCQSDPGDANAEHPRLGEEMPDFTLVDVNPTSPTATMAVSPRDHIGMRSAWYFGHAT